MFSSDRPTLKERDEFMTYRILLSLELFLRRLGRRSVSPEQSVLRPSVPGVYFFRLGVGCWGMMGERSWLSFGMNLFSFFLWGFECWEKRISELTW